MEIDKFIEWLTNSFGRLFYFTKGSKYYKVITKSGFSASVYCFVDNDGNIYLPSSWSKPAKHIRGNINSPELCCDRFGIKYRNKKGELC